MTERALDIEQLPTVIHLKRNQFANIQTKETIFHTTRINYFHLGSYESLNILE